MVTIGVKILYRYFLKSLEFATWDLRKLTKIVLTEINKTYFKYLENHFQIIKIEYFLKVGY